MLREFLGFGSSSVAVQASRVGSGLVVAALLGPTEWGTWYLLNLVVAYGALTQLGALNGMNREVPAARGVGDEDEARDLRRAALGTLLVTTGSVVAMLSVLALFAPLGVAPGLILLMGVLLMGHQLYGYAVTSLRATVRFTTVSRLQFASAVLYPAFGIFGAWSYGLQGFIMGQALTYAILVGFSGFSNAVLVRPLFDLRRARALVRIGFPIMMVGLVHTLFATVDRWVIASRLGTESLGYYSLAIMALGAVGLLPQVIAQQYYPRLAFAWSARHDPNELRTMAAQQRRFTFLVVVPVVAVTALVVPSAVRTWLPSFEPGVPALLVTMLVPVVTSIGQGYGGVLHVLDRQRWYLAMIGAAAVVNLGLSVVLVGPYGLVGVAVATLVAFGFLSLLRIVFGSLALRREAPVYTDGRSG